jgi:hypothetical protein
VAGGGSGGNILDILVQRRRDKHAAKKFFRKLLKGLTCVPRMIITDELKSYGTAKREMLPSVEHRQYRYLNNRAENSHQPTCPSRSAAIQPPHSTPLAHWGDQAPVGKRRSMGSSTRFCAALCLLRKQQLDKRNRRLIGVASGLDVGFHFHVLPSLVL